MDTTIGTPAAQMEALKQLSKTMKEAEAVGLHEERSLHLVGDKSGNGRHLTATDETTAPSYDPTPETAPAELLEEPGAVAPELPPLDRATLPTPEPLPPPTEKEAMQSIPAIAQRIEHAREQVAQYRDHIARELQAIELAQKEILELLPALPRAKQLAMLALHGIERPPHLKRKVVRRTKAELAMAKTGQRSKKKAQSPKG